MAKYGSKSRTTEIYIFLSWDRHSSHSELKVNSLRCRLYQNPACCCTAPESGSEEAHHVLGLDATEARAFEARGTAHQQQAVCAHCMQTDHVRATLDWHDHPLCCVAPQPCLHKAQPFAPQDDPLQIDSDELDIQRIKYVIYVWFSRTPSPGMALMYMAYGEAQG